MFKKLIYRLTHRHHYWRDIGFDELSELYTSMMLRSLATSLVGIFIPFYLYKLGFSIQYILFFYGFMMLLWGFCSLLSAYVVARIGPKHSMLMSYLLQIFSMGQMVMIANSDWPMVFVALSIAASYSLFFVAFHVDFSKIKHSEHGGKEIGWMVTMEKIGNILGPLVGGLVAYFFDARYIFIIAAALLLLGAVPLFLTAEPVKIRQYIDFSQLRGSGLRWDYRSYAAVGIENTICMIVWPLFAAVYLLSDNPYAELGSIASAAIVASLLVARVVGKVIDEHRGRTLLRAGVILNSIVHLFRPFVTGYTGVLAVNIANEGITVMYRMPYYKGYYDHADDLPGRRIVYIASMEAVAVAARSAMYFIAAAAVLIADPKTVLVSLFLVGSVASCLIMLERFRALRVR